MPVLEADYPISQKDEDQFGRAQFAETLAQELVDYGSGTGFVAAIEGPWGSGKSSLLNLVKNRIAENPKPSLILDFNPWVISGADDLILGFLSELSSKIASEGTGPQRAIDRTVKAIRRYGHHLSMLKHAPDLDLSLLGRLLDKTKGLADRRKGTIDGLRSSVERKLQEFDRPIFVFIDDLDRMDRSEVMAMYRLLKAVANFGNIIYILAFDRDRLESLVGETTDMRPANSSPHFFDKVVQLSYGLPPLTSPQRRDYFRQLLSDIQCDLPSHLMPFEETRMEEAFNKGVLAAVRSPRDIKRICSRVRLSGRATRHEVNFGDIVAFETLAVCFPEIERMIRRHPLAWCAVMDETDYHIVPAIQRFIEADRDEEDGQGGIRTLTARYDESSPFPNRVTSADLLESLLTFLFPSRFSNEQDTTSLEAEWRIGAVRPLMQLLALGSQVELVPSRVAQSFLREPELRGSMVNAPDSCWDLMDLLPTVVAQARTHDVVDVPDAAEWICEAVCQIFQTQEVDVSKQAADLLCEFVTHNGSDAQIAALLHRLAENSRYIGITELVLSKALEEHGEFPGRGDRAVSAESRITKDIAGVRDAVSAWLATTREAAKRDPDKIIRSVNAAGILYRWGQFQEHDFGEPRAFVAEVIASDSGAAGFLKVFAGSGAHSGISALLEDPETARQRLQAIAQEMDNLELYKELITAIDNLSPKDRETNEN